MTPYDIIIKNNVNPYLEIIQHINNAFIDFLDLECNQQINNDMCNVVNNVRHVLNYYYNYKEDRMDDDDEVEDEDEDKEEDGLMDIYDKMSNDFGDFYEGNNNAFLPDQKEEVKKLYIDFMRIIHKYYILYNSICNFIDDKVETRDKFNTLCDMVEDLFELDNEGLLEKGEDVDGTLVDTEYIDLSLNDNKKSIKKKIKSFYNEADMSIFNDITSETLDDLNDLDEITEEEVQNIVDNS